MDRKKVLKKTTQKITYDVPAKVKNQKMVIAPKSKKDDELMVWINQEPIISLDKIKALAGVGVDKNQIAKMMGINRNIFNSDSGDGKILLEAFEEGLAEGIATVTQSLFNTANDPENRNQVTAAIFWLKNKAGWRDTIEQKTEHDIGKNFVDMIKRGYERRDGKDGN